MRNLSTSILALAAPALLLAGCSAQKSEDASAPAGDAAAESAAVAQDKGGPDISRAAAPGVAFSYDYAFSLPSDAISKVQREHAAACEKLGTGRCRITGMSYDQNGEDQISAKLDFLLAPDIAHDFAADGVSAVEKAEGKLDNAAVAGENAGDAIKLSQSDSAAVQAEVARIQARLAAKGLTGAERAELQSQIAGLQGQLRGNAAERRAKEQTIATTPVRFTYASQGALGGNSNLFGQAASAGWNSAKGVFGLIAIVLGFALPWLALAGLIYFAVRGIKARRIARHSVTPATAAEPTPLQ